MRATYDAIARIGSQQLSLRGIAREINVSPSLLIYHFGSHEKLLIETMRWVLESTVRRIQQQIEELSDPEEALDALLEAIFTSPQRSRNFQLVYMDLVQYSIRHPSFIGLTDLLRTHINSSYATVIKVGVQAGAFRVVDVDLAVRQARSIVEGGMLQWLQDPDWRENYPRLRSNCYHALLILFRHHCESSEKFGSPNGIAAPRELR
ncbi:hypothetical protein CcI49_11325 [Frankia sp. CcI49]|nr:hypothetical protein CcI49_11325 [Frankia sp. CcI49]